MSAVIEQAGFHEIHGEHRRSMYVAWQVRYNEFTVHVYERGRRVLEIPGKLTKTRLWEGEREGLQLAISSMSFAITQQEHDELAHLLASLTEPS